MELVKLENLRDQIVSRIRQIEKFNDALWNYTREKPQSYIAGQRAAKIDEVIFLEKQLESILKEIEEHADTKVAKTLGLERVDCDCEECKALSLNAQKLDEVLSKVKDILIEFHVKDSKYCLEVHEIIEDCYRLQDEIREDVREDLKDKKENKKYTVISFIKEGCCSDGGFDSLESAKEHASIMINNMHVFKVEIREAGSNKLVNQIPRTGEPEITMYDWLVWKAE